MLTRKGKLMLLFLFLLTGRISAQWEKTLLNIPVTVPPSPTSASLGKYGVWPVSYYTGTPQISIPLYEVKSGDIKVPISLSYHASGITVEEMASWIGLGWSLNAGGVITRTVMGGPDEKTNGYISMLSRYKGDNLPSAFDVVSNTDDLAKFIGFSSGQYDCEPDVISFNFNGRGGKMTLDANNNFIASNFNQLKITVNPLTNYVSGGNNYWEIVDEQGFTYTFGNTDGRESSYILDDDGSTHVYNRVGTVTTAWYLNRIISPDKKDTVNFKYVFKSESYLRKAQQIFRIAQVPFGLYSHMGTSTGYGYKNDVPAQFQSTGNCQLSSIEWKFGKVILTATTDRTDMQGKLLDNISVYDNNSSLLNAYSFVYGYVNSRLFLNELDFKGADNNQVNNYKFSYISGVPDRLSNAQDFWGYYNGANNSWLIPYEPVFDNFSSGMSVVGGAPNADRETNNSYITAGSLGKITFPTGGYTDFEYEANDYYKKGDGFTPGTTYPNLLAGGIRVKSISNYSASGVLADKRSFTYRTSAGNSTGVLFAKPKFASVNYQQFYNPCIPEASNASSYYFIATSTPYSTAPLGSAQGSNVGYSFVTEYLNDGTTGKIEYNYSMFNDEWNDVSFSQTYNQFDRPPFMPSTNNDYKRGLLLRQTAYKKVASGYDPVADKINVYDYNDAVGSDHFQLLKVLKVKRLGDTTTSCALVPDNWYASMRQYEFAYGFYNLKSVWPKLTSTEDRLYDQVTPANYTSETKTYSYENINHLNATKIESLDSRNRTKTVQYKFPRDMVDQSLDPTGVYQDMLNKNIINELVEQKTSLNGTQTERMRKNFFSGWYADKHIISPKTIEAQIGSAATEQRLVYHAYDNDGNVLEVSKLGDLHMSYIWDYQNTFPIAEVKNAVRTDIAYTSFEADGTGNWIISSPARDSVLAAATGRKSYNLSNGNITKSGLTTSNIYILSYWTKNASSLTITGTQGTPVKGKTINGWTYYGHTITGQSTVTISGSGFIDELRLYPRTAQMTTYTYSPLLGMTGSCDMDNRATTYEYDPFGRLTLVRDQDKYTVKRICYNFSDQPEACSYFYNAYKSQAFTKTCTAGYLGTSETYIVPAGRYTSTVSQADADQKAQKEIDAYGQTNANTVGACNPTVYAELTYENLSTSANLVTGNVVVRFYSNPGLSIPMTVNNLTLNWKETVTVGSSGATNNNQSTANGVTSKVLLSGAIFYSVSGTTTTRNYYLTAGSGYVFTNSGSTGGGH